MKKGKKDPNKNNNMNNNNIKKTDVSWMIHNKHCFLSKRC